MAVVIEVVTAGLSAESWCKALLAAPEVLPGYFQCELMGLVDSVPQARPSPHWLSSGAILAAWGNLDMTVTSRCVAPLSKACDLIETQSELVGGTLVQVPRLHSKTFAPLCSGRCPILGFFFRLQPG